MKGLLIVLTAIAMVAALYLGGCAIVGLREYLTRSPNAVMYVDLYRDIAVASVFGLVFAVALLATNALVLYGLFRGMTRRRLTAVRVLAVVDGLLAIAALAWLMWADSWHWADWPWTWLAKAAACLLAIKGILIWRLVGRAPPGRPDSQSRATRSA
jgi:hypothetical protein